MTSNSHQHPFASRPIHKPRIHPRSPFRICQLWFVLRILSDIGSNLSILRTATSFDCEQLDPLLIFIASTLTPVRETGPLFQSRFLLLSLRVIFSRILTSSSGCCLTFLQPFHLYNMCFSVSEIYHVNTYSDPLNRIRCDHSIDDSNRA